MKKENHMKKKDITNKRKIFEKSASARTHARTHTHTQNEHIDKGSFF